MERSRVVRCRWRSAKAVGQGPSLPHERLKEAVERRTEGADDATCSVDTGSVVRPTWTVAAKPSWAVSAENSSRMFRLEYAPYY